MRTSTPLVTMTQANYIQRQQVIPKIRALLLVAFVFTLTQQQLAAEVAKPSIVLILTDDHGWSQTSHMTDPPVPASVSSYLETPNMNRLAEEGMRFTSGYSPAPLCTPTRRSILCGAANARCGSEFRSEWVPAEHMTIPKALKLVDPNYRCAHFGKWGELMTSTPEQCGYDDSDGTTGNNTGGMPATLGIKGGTRLDRRTLSTTTIPNSWSSDGPMGRWIAAKLYDLGENPVEEGRDRTQEQKQKADALEATLLAFLKSVDAQNCAFETIESLKEFVLSNPALDGTTSRESVGVLARGCRELRILINSR